MKIGIVTITSVQNYGNRLQNFALQEVLKSLGHDVDTIWNSPNVRDDMCFKEQLKCYIRKIFHLKYVPRIDRIIKFNKFNKKFIKWSKVRICNTDISKSLYKRYDFFVCGSDQVWNLSYQITTPFMFLTFAEPKQKIAYAASIGMLDLNNKQKSIFKDRLDKFEHISVREKKAALFLEEVLKRTIDVMPDPTLLLTREMWRKLEKKPKNHDDSKKYMLSYFLGDKKIHENSIKSIFECGKKKFGDFQEIFLEDCSEDGTENPYYYTMDPLEFLWLINHAEIICTDSFHGSVFSIIFHKPFLVYERDGNVNMSSRIEQLMYMFDMQDRMAQYMEINEQVYQIDCKNVDSKIMEEHDKAITFLKNSLKM